MAAYTAIDDSSAYFQTAIYTGNGGTQSITFAGNSDLQPDWVWIKNRSSTNNHRLFDSVRGAGKNLVSNNTGAEIDAGTGTDGQLRSFTSDGFTVGSDGSVNNNNEGIVSWNWLAGTSVSGNTTGSGTAKAYSGSVNTDSGFSITTFTGNGTANHTLPHNLGVAPDWFIIKKRIGTGDSTARDWNVYHKSLGNTKRIALNSTGAVSTSNEYWNNTSPTSSVINLGTNDQINGDNNTYICYAFAEKKGFSRFGSYLGNGNANGKFVYLGFKPAFLMVKKTSGTGIWGMYDNKRIGFNGSQGVQHVQRANDSVATSAAGGDAGGFGGIDFLSNGFKCKLSDANMGADGATYIFMAFAENPVVTSTGVPATAS